MRENKLTISNHHKIPVTSPGLVFGQKPFFVGLFLGEFIIGRVYYRDDFFVTGKRFVM